VGCGDGVAAVSAKVETAELTESYIQGVAIK